MPDVVIDRAKFSVYFGYITISSPGFHEAPGWYEEPGNAKKKRGQYRDVDEIVRHADGSLPDKVARGPSKKRSAAKAQQTSAADCLKYSDTWA